jgi:predicted Rossmann fold nucleotide-binding protein DprA/Smf involved in DNA uptake
VVDALYGSTAQSLLVDPRERLAGELLLVITAVADGHDSAAALSGVGLAPERVMAALASLELSGHVRRQSGGRYAVIP